MLIYQKLTSIILFLTPQYAVEDFVDWEKEHGLIPEGSVVLVKSGWSKYYPDPEKFIG